MKHDSFEDPAGRAEPGADRLLARSRLAMVVPTLVVFLFSALVIWSLARTASAIDAMHRSDVAAAGLRELMEHATAADRAEVLLHRTGAPLARDAYQREAAAFERDVRSLQHRLLAYGDAESIGPVVEKAEDWLAHVRATLASPTAPRVDFGSILLADLRQTALRISRDEQVRLERSREARRRLVWLTRFLLLAGAVVSLLALIGARAHLRRDEREQAEFTHALRAANLKLQDQAAAAGHAADALEEANRRTALLLESTGEGICGVDAAGRCTFINRAGATLLGYTPAELMGRELHATVHRDLSAGGHAVRDCPIHRVLRTGEAARTLDDVLRRADDVSFPAEVSVFPVREDDILTGAVLTFCDMSEGRRAQARLLASEEELRTLFAAMTDVVLTVDEDGRYTRVGTSAHTGAGRAEEALLGRTIREIFPAETAGRFLKTVEEVRATMVPVAVDYSLVDGGEPIWFSATVSPLRDGRVLWVARDVTERRRTEDALRRSQEQLLQAQKMDAVGQLASGIAHDFNNLLTVIRGNAQLLLLDLPGKGPMREELREIDHASERAAALTRQLLTFSRNEITQPRLVSLNDVARGAEGLLARLIRENVVIAMKLDPSVGPVLADPAQLEMVIVNLSINARDAMPAGGRLEIVTRHGRGPDGPTAVLEVRDTGHGMDEETRARLFEPFFTTKPPGQGTGLGLASVHGVVTQACGTIDVDTSPGQGTTFTISLPAADGDRSGGADLEEARWEAVGRSETILLVEDDPAVRSLVTRLLRRAGYQVIAVATGEQALRKVTERPDIALLVSDVVMPGMSGPELLEELRRRRVDTFPVLLMSGHADDPVRVQRLVDGGVPILWKPFTLGEFLSNTRTVLAARPT